MGVIKAIQSLYKKDKQKELLVSSEVFCMAPWVNLHAQPDGHAYPCAISCFDKRNAIGSFYDTPRVNSMWNSTGMKQLRTAMIKGEKSDTCKRCYEYERIGKPSDRKQFNTDYAHHFDRIDATMPDGSCESTEILSLDIRFSNQCNYKCRICNAEPSSLWRDDAIELGIITEDYPRQFTVAKDNEAFWDSFILALPHIEKMHFAGGEPLFMEEHYKTLEHLIAINKTDVQLTYNTNLSTLRYKQYNVLDLWAKFSRVNVSASLDDMGPRGDYQRKGQRWDMIERNMKEIKNQCPNVNFGINATVSIFNVFYIPEFYTYLVENNFIGPDGMNLYLLFDPMYFSIRNLTPTLKQEVAIVYESFIERLNPLPKTETIRQHAGAVIKHMLSEDYNQRDELINWISKVDTIRKEVFSSTFPEISRTLL